MPSRGGAFSATLAIATVAAAASSSSACDRGYTIARRSKCPSSRWKDVVAPLLIANRTGAQQQPITCVIAGANKGFAVAEFLQRFHDDGGATPSNKQWFKSIRAIKPSGMFGCGMCGACKEPLPPPSARSNVSVKVVAFELLKPNYILLTRLFERHRVPGVAVHAAVSNYTGTAYAPTGVRTGQEWTSAELGAATDAATPSTLAASSSAPGDQSAQSARAAEVARRPARLRSKAWSAVPSTTVDAYAAASQLARIEWLSVDAEGWDPLILEGTQQLLSAHRVDILEFEYHSKGMWASALPDGERRDLKRTLERLDAHGYACFWQGDKGSLAEASGRHWCDTFELRAHSNLVCSWRPDVTRALRGLAQPQGA